MPASADGVDAHGAVSAIKQRLAEQHGITHATVEPEFGQCADAALPGPEEHAHAHAEHDHQH